MSSDPLPAAPLWQRALRPMLGIFSALPGIRGSSRSSRLRARRQLLAWSLSLHRPFQPIFLGRRLTSGEVGLAGELLAARWLRQQKRKVLYRNFVAPVRGEVDIVARHGQVLTFIEVKTRTRDDVGRPADNVGTKKRELIQRGATCCLQMLRQPQVRYRFDIVEVLLLPGRRPQLHLIENAFPMRDSAMIGR